MLDDLGLNYICQSAERFYAVATVLSSMVKWVKNEKESTRLLRHTIRCYARVADNERARDALKQCLPDELRTMNTFKHLLEDDPQSQKHLSELIQAINQPTQNTQLF